MTRISYTQYCHNVFGQRMQKLPIDAGFSCPNRDGTLGAEGCCYCNNAAFNPAYCGGHKNISQQINQGIAFHRRRRRGKCGYLAYFQAYSNTHAPLEVLRQRYAEALAHPMVEGLVIGTRPDCVDPDKLDYLEQLAREHYVMVEYGIESCYDRTLQWMNRGHNFDCTARAIADTAHRGIRCGGHLILGLPGESRADMVAEAEMLSTLPLETLKLHQLQVLRGAALERQYRIDPACVPPPFGVEEYVDLVCDFLSRLRTDIVVERYASEVPPVHQAAPERGWRHADGSPVRAYEISGMVEKRLNLPQNGC